MKKLLTLSILLIGLSNCDERRMKIKPFVITAKAYKGGVGIVDLPPGICYYYYNIDNIFQDSCNKYNIGDTIK